MDFWSTVAHFMSTKNAFNLLALLNIHGFLYPPSKINVEKTYNYVIVGGGTAGCVVANRLSENPNVTVLLIEAGGNPPMESAEPALVFYTRMSPIDWNFTVYDAMKGKYEIMNHGKVLGGTSSIDSMRFSRGSVHDYDTWGEEVNDVNWKWENVLPYFMKSEKMVDEEILHSKSAVYHGTEGYIGLHRTPHVINENYIDAFHEVGYPKILDVNTVESVGFVQPLYMVDNGMRQSTAYSYMRADVVRNRNNLNLLTHAHVTKIIFGDYNIAEGVEVLLENGEKVVVKSTIEIILSAGSVKTPQILMHSGIGPKEHLESFNINTISDLPVGENGRQHSIVLRAYKLNSKEEKPDGIAAESPNPVFNGFVAINKSQLFADYLAFSTPITKNSRAVVDLCSAIFPNKDFICQKLFNESMGSELLINLLTIFNIKARAKVELNDTDPLSTPLILINVFEKSDDIRMDLNNFAESLKNFDRVRNSTLFRNADAKLIEYDIEDCSQYEFESHDYLLCYIVTTMRTPYIFGTCPMGTVTDTRFRVKGVQNLRVVDSSTIPTVIRAEIIPTVVMLAEKASDLIKEDNIKKNNAIKI